MNKQLTIVAMTLLCCVIAFLSSQAFGQALIVSEREKIVSYSDEELNPENPRYEWEGSTLLRNIRVIDGLGNRPQTGQDVLIANGKIQAVGKSGSLNVPTDARIIEGDGLTAMPGLIDAHMHLSSGWRGPNDNGNRPTGARQMATVELPVRGRYASIRHRQHS